MVTRNDLALHVEFRITGLGILHLDFRDLDFDYVADPASRDEVRLRVRESWRSGAAAGGGRDAVLLDTNGRLREAEFARLLSGRDERRVSLEE